MFTEISQRTTCKRTLLRAPCKTTSSSQPPLTRMQLKALAALSRGMTMKDIAAESGVSIHTVHAHLRMAYKRLGANGSNHAVALAVRASLI